jgi:hypothetical protein
LSIGDADEEPISVALAYGSDLEKVLRQQANQQLVERFSSGSSLTEILVQSAYDCDRFWFIVLVIRDTYWGESIHLLKVERS